MADNIKVTQGAGADPDVATNDKSGRHVQIVQLDIGGDTTVTELTGGQKAMASSLPVVIASDQSALNVALGVGTNNIGDVDVLSVVPGTGATNLGKAEDAVHASGDVGVMALVVRNDAGGTLVNATGDYSPLQVDANGALRVTGGGGGTEVTEDIASAADPVGGQVILRRRDTLSGTEVTADGDNIAANATSKGELYVKHVDAIPVTDNAGSLTVDGTVSVSGTVTVDSELPTAASLADNTPNPTVPAVGAFNMVWDGTNWDRAPGTSADGVLVNLGANNDVAVTNATASNLNAEVQGDAGHNAALSGNPVRIGARGVNAELTAVTNGNTTDIIADLSGRQIVLQGGPHERHSNGTATYTTTTAADVIAAAGAGIKIAVTSILVTNAHATQGTKVEILDNATVVIRGFAAANGGGFALNAGGRPLFISAAANTAIRAQCVTTGADVDVSIGGYRTV